MRGLGDRHEKPLDVGIGDGDRAAPEDLLLELRHHAAVAPEDVAETDDDERRPRRGCERLDIPLGEEFRASHHARRLHRLVGGDGNETPDGVLLGQTHEQPGAETVVRDRFPGVLLEHRDMLVGRRVEHHFGPLGIEDIPDPRCVEDVGKNERHRHPRPQRHQAVLSVEQGVFGTLDDDEPARTVTEHLSADLRPDRPPPSGDEDHAVADDSLDRRVVENDRFPAEEIADLDRPEHVRGGDGPPRGEQFAHRWDHLHVRTELGGIAQEPAEHRPRELPGRDEDLVDRALPQHLPRVIDAAEHAEPGDPRTAEKDVVVEEADDDVRRRVVGREIPREELAGLRGADDQSRTDVAAGDPWSEHLADRPRQRTEAADEEHGRRPIDHHHAPGEPLPESGEHTDGLPDDVDRDQRQGGQGRGEGEPAEIGERQPAEPPAELIMEEEHDRLHDDDPDNRGTKHRHHRGIGLEVPTGQEGGKPDSEKQPDVHQQHRHRSRAETENARA